MRPETWRSRTACSSTTRTESMGGVNPTGTINIQNSEFNHNGSGTGYTHNLYVGAIYSLTITGSYFH